MGEAREEGCVGGGHVTQLAVTARTDGEGKARNVDDDLGKQGLSSTPGGTIKRRSHLKGQFCDNCT